MQYLEQCLAHRKLFSYLPLVLLYYILGANFKYTGLKECLDKHVQFLLQAHQSDEPLATLWGLEESRKLGSSS